MPLATGVAVRKKSPVHLVLLGAAVGSALAAAATLALTPAPPRHDAAAALAMTAAPAMAAQAVVIPAAETAASAPAPSSEASPAPSDAPVPTAAGAPQVTTGVVIGSPGHRLWIDGTLAASWQATVSCGSHLVQVGSAGTPRTIDLPCGEELLASP